PGPGSTAAGASYSLLGSDVVALHAGNCEWTAVPGNSKQRRCTFDLAVENRLTVADLVTPTTFPQPPAGTSGILVFPFAAAALGVPGGGAVPSPDWDNAPANFFNDFSGCTGKNSDCYRSETYPGPLYGGEVTEARTVGFDVDRNAHSVSVYIVVAADLRENIPQQVVLSGTQCGSVRSDGEVDIANEIKVGADSPPVNPKKTRGFCGFELPAVLDGKRVRSATLRMFQAEVAGLAAYSSGLESVLVDHIDYGATLGGTDYDIEPLEAATATLSTDATIGFRLVEVAERVQADLDAGRRRTQFRFRWSTDILPEPGADGAYSYWDNTSDPNPPRLTIVYGNW
ncbi:MAG TPA: hypothetical protein VK936_07550, partial [Longimicrobiales bacterium]|nr:hypothetical protein [Longimicrobiales bacterium]